MQSKFRIELEQLINRHNMESRSNTHDFVLAGFLMGCLDAFDDATNWRDRLKSNRKSKPLKRKVNTATERASVPGEKND